jgi:hypothetical protein
LYNSERIKESLLIFLGTLLFNKIIYCAMLGMSNDSTGAVGPATGAIFLVIKDFIEYF